MPEKNISKITIASRLDRILIFLISAFVYFNILYFQIKIYGSSKLLEGGQSNLSILSLITVASIYVSIYILIESIFKNTLFKYLFGYKVVTLSNTKPKIHQFLIRNLLRIVDDILIIGRITMYWSDGRRRLGDILAGTKLVNKNDDL